jgi:hypothetical protein
MNLNKIEENKEEIELTQWPLTKHEQLFAANLALSQALICGLDALKQTAHYKHSLKQKGNQFIEELERHFTPLNDLVFHINADGKFNECVGAYEWMVEFMANTDPETFLEAINKLKSELC